MNAIIWAARNGVACNGSTIYTTFEPCTECTKNILASGIKRIVYKKKYEYNDSEITKKFVEKNGLIIEQIK